MTLGPKQEKCVMTSKHQPQSPQEYEQFCKDLDAKIIRLLAESLDDWRKCDQVACRRAKGCASERRECIARWQATLPPISEHEAAKRKADLKRELQALIAGLPIDALKNERRAQARAASRSANNGDGKAPAPVVETPLLSPEKQARIDRAWNDYVDSQEKDDRAREPGPRITRL
jgi:hypothetical protein